MFRIVSTREVSTLLPSIKKINYICILYTRKLCDYKITFVNSQHKNINSKGDYVLKNRFKHSFKNIWYTKIDLSQKSIKSDLVW